MTFYVMNDTRPTKPFETKDEALSFIQDEVGPIAFDAEDTAAHPKDVGNLWVYLAETGERFVIGERI